MQKLVERFLNSLPSVWVVCVSCISCIAVLSVCAVWPVTTEASGVSKQLPAPIFYDIDYDTGNECLDWAPGHTHFALAIPAIISTALLTMVYDDLDKSDEFELVESIVVPIVPQDPAVPIEAACVVVLYKRLPMA